MKVVVIKLITGEEVVASNDGCIYSKPRTFQVMQTQTGMNVGLIPWLLAAPDSDVVITDDKIMTKIDCPMDVERSYLQQVSSIDLSGAM